MTNIVALLIVLHMADGRIVLINPDQVTHLRSAREVPEADKTFTGAVKCMVNLADGKYVTVVEPCDAVRQKMEGK